MLGYAMKLLTQPTCRTLVSSHSWFDTSPRTASHIRTTQLFHLSPLNTDPHHPAVADRLQFRDADLDPRGVEVLEDDLRDVFGQGFQQREMPFAQHRLDMLRDFGVVQRVVDVVGLAGAAVGA